MDGPYPEDDWLPISALQHFVFCERQCALILLEGLWADNPLTVEGGHLHGRVHGDLSTECRGDVRIARRLAIRTERLGLTGYADMVEFRRVDHPGEGEGKHHEAGTVLPGVEGLWSPFPVEYKRGQVKPDRRDEVQLCAQAIALEEMLHVGVGAGALYYGRPRRRQAVSIDAALREYTVTAASRLHSFVRVGVTPEAVYRPGCDNCSLVELCMPRALCSRRSVAAYLKGAVLSDEPESQTEEP